VFIHFILLILFSGVPYYIYFEKSQKLKGENIFFLSAFLVLCGMLIEFIYPQEACVPIVIVALLTSLFSFYKANKTNNLFKLSYYILFFNAPMLLMFENNAGILYGISLLFALLGIYLMGKYYEKNYGSANYRSITGITLVTPYAGLFLTIYLTTLALYPPFPNSLLFLNVILTNELNILWYLVVIVIFFGNFLIAVKVMARTVFGKPNENVHYIELTKKEIIIHILMITMLFILSVVGLREVLS